MAPYNDAHRLFLQAAISRREILKSEAEEIVTKISSITHYETDLSSVLEAINGRLDALGFQIRTARNQDTGQESFIFVNTEQDIVSQLATNFSAVEITLFKNLIEYIFEQSDWEFAIGGLKALRYSPAGFSKSASEACLGRFVNHGWMNRSVSGNYTLSLRALTELDSAIREEYADAVVECHACKEIVTRGQRCSNAECDAALHHHCANRAMARRSHCPKCDLNWDRQNKIGEGAKGRRRGVRISNEGTSVGQSGATSSRGQSILSMQSESQASQPEENVSATQASESPSSTIRTSIQGSSGRKRRIIESDQEDQDNLEEQSITPSPSRRKGKQPRR